MQQVSAEITRINFSLARAYLSVPQTGVASGDYRRVLLDAESYDIGNNFSSYKYTAPVTGYYHVSFWVEGYSATTKLCRLEPVIYKNGVIALTGQFVNTLTDVAVQNNGGDDDIYLTAGQYLELYAFVTTTSGTIQFSSAAMSVHLIST